MIFISESILQEATGPMPQKIHDVALMTSNRFMTFINQQDKFHPSHAYKTKYKKNMMYINYDRIPIHINNIKIAGYKFELKLEKTKKRYYKVDDEKNPLRDEKGKLISLTDQEIEQLGKRKYEHFYVLFDEEKIPVASLHDDEWGALLITVVEEFRSLGLGEVLMNAYYKNHEMIDSGGMTEHGAGFMRKWHSQQVRKYMASGFYSHLIRTNQISKEKVQEIIASIQPYKKKKIKNANLKMNDPDDYLLMQVSPTEFIIYNKIAYDLLNTKEEERHSFFIPNIIKGHTRLIQQGGSHKTRIHFLNAETQPLESFLYNVLLTSAKKNNIKVYNSFNPDDEKMLSPNKEINYIPLIQKEQKYRKQKDQYDELKTAIIELAYKKWTDT